MRPKRLGHNSVANTFTVYLGTIPELQPALLSMGLSRQEYWSGLPCPPPGDLPNPGTEPRSPTVKADSLSSEPPGKPTDTGVGSARLLQGIFSPQVANRGLLHYRQILYQINYQGSPTCGLIIE